jgi:hypothetical protein
VTELADSLPSFDVALAQLRRFLHANQIRRPDLRWIFREDVALRGRSLLVRAQLRHDANLVRERYASAAASRARGIVIGAEGIDDEAVFCTLFVPISDDDAEHRMVAGLKLTILEPLPPVVTVDDATWRIASDAHAPEQRVHLDDRFQREDAD